MTSSDLEQKSCKLSYSITVFEAENLISSRTLDPSPRPQTFIMIASTFPEISGQRASMTYTQWPLCPPLNKFRQARQKITGQVSKWGFIGGESFQNHIQLEHSDHVKQGNSNHYQFTLNMKTGIPSIQRQTDWCIQNNSTFHDIVINRKILVL